jgi:phosphopantothenoylcysteine decarboxylase
MIIVPLSANTLAKITNGLCDNLLTCVFRAWDFSKKVMVAPAMNTYMYENQITEN